MLRAVSLSRPSFLTLYLKRGDLDADARDNWRVFPGNGACCVSYESCSLACLAAPMRAIIGTFFQEMGPAV
jgi:hypothetical protein